MRDVERNSFTSTNIKPSCSPIKSPTDKKDYKIIELPNGLRALLISDASYDLKKLEEEEIKIENGETVGETGLKSSAASLCIEVGSYSDPKGLPGLAHFLEHMVFMGSEKYPEENHFDKFISGHNGYTNASTGTNSTNFCFSISRKHFAE